MKPKNLFISLLVFIQLLASGLTVCLSQPPSAAASGAGKTAAAPGKGATPVSPTASAPAALPADDALLSVQTRFGTYRHPAVNRWIRRYPPKEWGHQLNHILADAGFYQSYILRQIKAAQLPPELFYLPVIESRYLNQAKSPVGATGIWQFMATSATPFGLTINTQRDERKDFMLATDAALQKLHGNYRETGDWLLAIAAYNCGLGAVQKALRQTNAADFWQLYEKKALPAETLNYVPKFLAVVYIMQHPRTYGIQPPKTPPIEWTKIAVHRPVHLKSLSEAAGIDYRLLQKANSELKQGSTPTDGNPYFLKVPEKDRKKVTAALKRRPALFANEANPLDKSDKSSYHKNTYEET